MDKILEKWDEILQTVKTEHDVSDISFDTWIKPLEVFGVEGNTLYILVPSEQMTLSYISKKYYLPLKVAIAEIIGTEYEIQFILPEQTRFALERGFWRECLQRGFYISLYMAWSLLLFSFHCVFKERKGNGRNSKKRHFSCSSAMQCRVLQQHFRRDIPWRMHGGRARRR